MSYGTNAPQGLQPRFYLSGANWNGALSEYQIVSGYATNLFSGDPVYCGNGANDGAIVIATAGDGNPLLGVFMGCKYINSAGVQVYSPYWPASTATQGAVNATAFVVDDPNVIFDIQTAATPVGIAQSNIFSNGNLSAGAGSTITGQSAWVLNATLNTTATFQVKLLRLTPVPTNVASAAYNNVCVLINNHFFKGGTGTLGVHT